MRPDTSIGSSTAAMRYWQCAEASSDAATDTKITVSLATAIAEHQVGDLPPRAPFKKPGWRNWQTQRTQNPPGFGPWGFDSPSRHQPLITHDLGYRGTVRVLISRFTSL
jgi:hypothetical protein